MSVENLTVSLRGEEILKPLSFRVEEGEAAAIIGPNGAGKTVLLKTLLGIIPYGGRYTWRSDVKIGYVPQRFHFDLSIPITVREFFLLHESGFLLAKRRASPRIMEALKTVGVSSRTADERISALSSGTIQRILVAWALYDKPNVLLFDEPTTGIDVGGEETIYNMLRHLQDRFGITIILVSHELNVVYRYATRVLCINRALVCNGVPDEVLTAKRLRELYGGVSFFHHAHPEQP